MPQICTLNISPDLLNKTEILKKIAAKQLKIQVNQITGWKVLKRSIDSRKRSPRYVLRVEVWTQEPFSPEPLAEFPLQNVANQPEAHVVGLGPAGLFAALHLIKLGYKPIVWERGKSVRDRRRDLVKITREGEVNPESNYCFGEGGAGTFSDGKLYTRSTKRGDTREVLEALVQFGATPEILVDAHPHIGTNKLPQIIQNIREKIIECGGEIHFNSKVTRIVHQEGRIKSIEINNQDTYSVSALILATGHSARDIFRLLHREGILIEAKSFALGVRVEHPQNLIDKIQYHCQDERHPNLPAASYSLVRQVGDKGVYSFCMCPGGIICPAATENDEIVVNGWSPSRRDSAFANSGIVVEVALDDLENVANNPLAGIEFQQKVERAAFVSGGGKQVAPAQRLQDFIRGKNSGNLPDCSYLPGIAPAELKGVLPKFIHSRLREGLAYFGKRLKGYATNEAVVVGVESRTSSPIRIPRDRQTLMHPQIEGLFPCGEGAGYAGGIMSAAIDGGKCAQGVLRFMEGNE